MAAATAKPNYMISFDFEIHGTVQGVNFRKHTKETAEQYGIVGWVMNTTRGTVQGQIQGPPEKLKLMREWLTTIGSPYSIIGKCEFKNERRIEDDEKLEIISHFFLTLFGKRGWQQKVPEGQKLKKLNLAKKKRSKNVLLNDLVFEDERKNHFDTLSLINYIYTC